MAMELFDPDDPRHDPDTQRRLDRNRLIRALNASLVFVLVLVLVYTAQGNFNVARLAVLPQEGAGLLGIVTAPLLHGSVEHIVANSAALLMLGTLAGSVYPRATLWSLPLIWVGSGLAAWVLGDAGTRHLGASGLSHGLMFLIFTLGLLRRDRQAIATGMVAFLFYGGMLLTVLPQEPGVSWQSHLGGAFGGVLGAFLFRKLDPLLPRKRYSWEDEGEVVTPADDELEPPAPREVPVLWQRDQQEEERGVVLRFPPRERD